MAAVEATGPARESLSPKALLTYYAAKLRTELALQFQYRGAILIWLLGLVMQPLIALVVWTTVARSQGGSAGGFTEGEYAAYFIILMVVNQLTFSWHMWEMDWRIRSGAYSGILLRPLHPIHNDIVENVSFKLLTLVPLVPIAITFSVIFDADYSWKPLNLILFPLAIVLAALLCFVLEWTIALAAFWITKTNALYQLYNSAYIFLAGMIAPLALMPGPVQTASTVLPFRWIVPFPVDMARGQLDAAEIARGFGMQALWIAVMLGALQFTWRHAIRRYSAVGA